MPSALAHHLSVLDAGDEESDAQIDGATEALLFVMKELYRP